VPRGALPICQMVAASSAGRVAVSSSATNSQRRSGRGNGQHRRKMSRTGTVGASGTSRFMRPAPHTNGPRRGRGPGTAYQVGEPRGGYTMSTPPPWPGLPPPVLLPPQPPAPPVPCPELDERELLWLEP